MNINYTCEMPEEPSDELLEIGRQAIEDALVAFREARVSVEGYRGNGLVIRTRDGRPSGVIRFGPETALRIGYRAMREAVIKGELSE